MSSSAILSPQSSAREAMPSINSSRTARHSMPSFSSRSVQSSFWTRSPNSSRPLIPSSGFARVGGGSISAVAGLLMTGAAARPADQKETMQDLNERLAHYLDKVRSLETGNRELEVQISALLEERRPVHRDLNPMLEQARGLNKQIHDLTLGNAAILLQIDNARLSAEDFKMKMESESLVRQAVENDIDRLSRVKEEYDVNAASLRNEANLLTEEVLFLKKNHAEDINGLKAQFKKEKVTVNVESSKGIHISVDVAKLRAEYEDLIAKNKAEAQSWYQSQLQVITSQIEVNTKALDDAKAEVSVKRQLMQGLVVELETLKAQITGLENILGETEDRYGGEFNELQLIISKREADLLNIRNEMVKQKENYEALLKIKLTLEAEIAEYRRLLNGDISTKPAPPPRTPTPPPEITTRKIVKVITTTLVDGKVVDESSKVQEYSEETTN